MQLIHDRKGKCCHWAPGDILSGDPENPHLEFFTVIYLFRSHPKASPSIT